MKTEIEILDGKNALIRFECPKCKELNEFFIEKRGVNCLCGSYYELRLQEVVFL